MTLYTQADSNIRKTWLLIFVFLVFIIGLGWIFSYQFNNPAILTIVVLFAIFQSFFSYWFSDKVVLAMSHAQLISKENSPELYRIVENLCITAGLPVPKIYIVPEVQPNAFATGRDKDHAAIAVTQGLLQKLDKTELEGVISHELSHIGNKDMLLMTIVVVLVGFVTIISHWFSRFMWFGGGRRRNNSEGGEATAIFALIGIILAILSPIIATLIQLAISRKREFLADASGVLLTRYPEGLASALEKISADSVPMKTASDATAHLYIVNPFKGKRISGLFLTHPPIEERIKILREMG
jgi:heat shock protein HtpX